MYAGQKSVRGGIQDFLCPFTDMYITQGSQMGSHRGTMANDVRGAEPGVRYPYYAPCDCKLIWFDKSNGQGMWQSTEKVRFSNGNISFATWVTAHDNSFDADKTMGQTIQQGNQLGNMGDAAGGGAYVTGIHCHIEISQHQYTINDWHKNSYGIWCFPNETDTDDCYFVDNTNIIEGMGGSWKHTTDVPVASDKYVNLPEWIEERNIYNSNKEQFATLKPKKFGGLSYKLYSQDGEFGEIETIDYGRCYVKITDSTPITDTPTYEHGNY